MLSWCTFIIHAVDRYIVDCCSFQFSQANTVTLVASKSSLGMTKISMSHVLRLSILSTLARVCYWWTAMSERVTRRAKKNINNEKKGSTNIANRTISIVRIFDNDKWRWFLPWYSSDWCYYAISLVALFFSHIVVHALSLSASFHLCFSLSLSLSFPCSFSFSLSSVCPSWFFAR